MNKDLQVWIGALMRGLIVGGLTFFSLAINLGICMEALESAAIAGGGYLFLELAKYYGIDASRIKNKKAQYKFIIFP